MSIRQYAPAKFLQLGDGSVVIFPHREHYYFFLATLEELSEIIGGTVSLQKGGLKLQVPIPEDGKEVDIPQLINSGDMYFVSSEGSHAGTKYRWLDAIFTSEEKAKLYASRRPNPMIIKGVWRDVLMPNYRAPRHLCVPVANAELSSAMLKRMMDLLFMEPFPIEAFA